MAKSGERGILKEEFGRFFSNSEEEQSGVKEWVISTLGTTGVGKTVLISGIYAHYHLGTEYGKLIGIESIGAELHDMLNGIAKGLKARPLRLPPTTREIQNASLKFLVKLPQQSTYQKIVALQDHAGEHLQRKSLKHNETLERLRCSDSFIVFLDSQQILRDDDYQDSAEEMELNLIKSLIRDISEGLHDSDIIPIAIAFSKSDTVIGREEELISRGVKIFESLSEELPQCVFCLTPVSVIKNGRSDDDPKFIFSLKNAEVPFLFCLASVVVRNAAILMIEADRAILESKKVAQLSLNGLTFFEKIRTFLGKIIESRRLNLKSRRYVSLSAYDIKLAQNALSLISARENVTYLQDGVVYDDIREIYNDLL